MKYEILLYYKYVSIEDPELLMNEQRALCEKLSLKGRIIVSKEGINGTVGGLQTDTEKYAEALHDDARFVDIHIKRSEGLPDAFPKLSIKVRPELVSSRLGDEDFNPAKHTGKRLSPAQLHEWLREGKDITIIDMRNSYEYRFGHFKNSIDPKMRRFEDLPKKIDALKNKNPETVVTVCTGGVRCEKASGYLLKKGFENVYQLDGGIVSYMEQYPGEDFEGSLFVFDKRQVMHFNDPEKHVPVSTCDYCKTPAEKLRNCADSTCNQKFISCESCKQKIECRKCNSCNQTVSI